MTIARPIAGLASRRVFTAALVLLVAFAFAGEVSFAAETRLGPVAEAQIKNQLDHLGRIALRESEVPVIVRVATDADSPTIHDAQAQLLNELAGSGAEVTRRYASIPALALTLGVEGLDKLRSANSVVGVSLDRPATIELLNSVPSIGGVAARDAGAFGRAATVAILDTGVDGAHPMLAGKVVGEACFSRSGNCPNNSTVMYGSGSGAPCTFANQCTHGTHVAGIAAGESSSRKGVAPSATVLAVQIFSSYNGSIVSWTSDQMAGLDWVYAQRENFSIAAANLSLGFSLYSDRATCDSDATNSGYMAAVNRLRSVGIATVAAAGNDGNSGSIAFPACMTGVYGVGSVNNSNVVSSFSNRNSMTSYFAPGESIISSVPGGGYASSSGTSMATPHVVGAFAVLRVAYPNDTLSETSARLSATGSVPFGDSYGKPRIDIWSAIGMNAFGRALPLSPALSSPVSASTVNATREVGEPLHAGVTSAGSLWWSFTAPSAGTLGLATIGSAIDTVLGVYTGNTVDALGEVASSDNISVGTSSAVSFTAIAGQRYLIAVAGKGAASGRVSLALTWLPSGGYHPISPVRVLDTRVSGGSMRQGETRPLGMLSTAGIPAAGVSAVAANITITGGTVSSFLTVSPTGFARPTASTLNWLPNQTRSNLAQTALGIYGAVSFFNAAGSVDLVVEVVGWYDDGGVQRAGGSEFHALSPARILDTRNAIGSVNEPFGAGETRSLTVAGHGGVPVSGATAAVINVTATDSTAPSFLTVWPAGEARPQASSLNWPEAATRPNLVIAALSADGKVELFNLTGNVEVVADVVGWYGADPGDSFVAQAPVRVLDTRDSNAPIAQGESRPLTIGGVAGVPAWATAVVFNLTATGSDAPTFLTASPAGVLRPLASNLNIFTGETAPNLVVVPIGSAGAISLYNNTGSVHVIVDIVGWFG